MSSRIGHHRRGNVVAYMALFFAFGLGTAAPPAWAGTAGPTESLGMSRGLEYLTADFAAVASQAGPNVLCDGGDTVTGGGGRISGDPATAHLNATRPISTAGEGWVAEGTADSGSRTVSAFAICGGRAVSWVPLGPAPVPSGNVYGSGTACPQQEQNGVGGGVGGTGGNIRILATFPFRPTYDWGSYVYNAGGTQASISEYAGCSTAYPVRYVSDSVEVGAGKPGSLRVRCGKRQAVTGGGFDLGEPGFESPETRLVSSRPVDLKPDANHVPDDAWLAKAYNGSAETQPLHVYAICFKAI